ncbi:hypothetical protein Hanom_Chr17g01569361 [Helianthus anomalus]
MRKNKPLDESRKSGQTSGMKMTFYSNNKLLDKRCFRSTQPDLAYFTRTHSTRSTNHPTHST